MRTTKGAVALVTALITIGAAGCGGGGDSEEAGSGTSSSAAGANADFVAMSPEEIKAEVVADMKALESMSMSASFTSDGQDVGFDLALDTDGTCVGTMTVGKGTAQILSVNGASYLKGDEAFWDASAGSGQGKQMQEMLGDRWAKLPAGQGGFESFCDLDSLLADFGTEDDGSTTVTKGDEGEVDGQPALQLVTDEDGGSTTVWVATSGEDHYILSIERSGEQSGSITLSGFNEPVEATEPSDAEVMDLSS